MAWFRKEKKPKEAVEKQTAIPEGLWVKCDDCKEIVYRKEVEQNLSVCPKCSYHFRLDARERFAILFDDNNYKEFATNIKSGDPLEFRIYGASISLRRAQAQRFHVNQLGPHGNPG